MSITPMSPALIKQGWVQTWVTSRWKNPSIPGQFSAEINSESFKGSGLVVNSFQDMKALADRGVPEALGVLDEAGQILGFALSNFINLLNPPNIVIGGGLAVLAPHLMPPAERILRRHTLSEALEHCTILISELSKKPHSYGPLAVALQGLSQLNADGSFPW